MSKRAAHLAILATCVAACSNNLPDSDRGPIDHEARQRIHQTRVDLRLLQQSIELHRERDPKTCPTFELLFKEQLVLPSQNLKDPWGQRYRIVCGANDDAIVSDGPDAEPETHDDIWSPAGPL